MRNIINVKKGDLSLIVAILVSGIMLILLLPLSQKITIESGISKENLMSQQAIQAAKTGIDDWKFNLSIDPPKIDINDVNDSRWPNIYTNNIDYTIFIDNNNNNIRWIVLNDDGNQQIQYRVEFTSNPPKIISRGRVKKNNLTIERTLEESFN